MKCLKHAAHKKYAIKYLYIFNCHGRGSDPGKYQLNYTGGKKSLNYVPTENEGTKYF